MPIAFSTLFSPQARSPDQPTIPFRPTYARFSHSLLHILLYTGCSLPEAQYLTFRHAIQTVKAVEEFATAAVKGPQAFCIGSFQ